MFALGSLNKRFSTPRALGIEKGIHSPNVQDSLNLVGQTGSRSRCDSMLTALGRATLMVALSSTLPKSRMRPCSPEVDEICGAILTNYQQVAVKCLEEGGPFLAVKHR